MRMVKPKEMIPAVVCVLAIGFLGFTRCSPTTGNVVDGPNPHKPFWPPSNYEEQCQGITTNVPPMTWVTSSCNHYRYLLVDGTNLDNLNDNYKRNWADANTFCAGLAPGGQLASIKSAQENLQVFCMAPYLENRWIGHTLQWRQSPDYQALNNAVPPPQNLHPIKPKISKNITLHDGQVVNVLIDSSATIRRGKRTQGSILLGGMYADGTDWMGTLDIYDKFNSSSYGNPYVQKPYIKKNNGPQIAPWFDLEPNNLRGNENCVEMGKAWQRQAPNGKWNDFRCDANKAFVCKACNTGFSGINCENLDSSPSPRFAIAISADDHSKMLLLVTRGRNLILETLRCGVYIPM